MGLHGVLTHIPIHGFAWKIVQRIDPDPAVVDAFTHADGTISGMQAVSAAAPATAMTGESLLSGTRRTDWRQRCKDLSLEPGSRVNIAFRLKEKSNPRFPGLDLEVVGLRLAT